MINVNVNVNVAVVIGIGFEPEKRAPYPDGPMTDETRFRLAKQTYTIPHERGHDPNDIATMHRLAYERSKR